MSKLQQKRVIAASAEMSSRPTEQKWVSSSQRHVPFLFFYDQKALYFLDCSVPYISNVYTHLFVIMVSETSEVAGGSSGVKSACNSGID